MSFDLPGATVHQVSTPGLGDHSYVVVIGELAVVVDPQRDLDRFEPLLEGLELAAVFETHIHNDYVSGGPGLAKAHHAGYILPEGSGATVAHNTMSPGDVIDLGSLQMRSIATPGHTPHHLSYALFAPDGSAIAAFTGGSMLVGAVGRCDLISPELTDRLVRDQYRSVNHLAETLDAPTLVAPTHGAGSFCSASEVSDTTSTIAVERKRNPALTTPDEDTFAAVQLAGYRLYPSYYAHMGPINARGADPLPELERRRLAPIQLAALGSIPIVDIRPAEDFAAGHLIGSINIPYSTDVATYAGWILDFDERLVLVADDESAARDVTLQLARIGFDHVAGWMVDGLAAWRSAGLPLGSYRVAKFDELLAERPTTVLDVRDPLEAAEGSLPGALNIHVGELWDRIGEVPDGEVWVHCASGYRASAAAAILEAEGRTPVLVRDDFAEIAGAAV